MSKEMKIEIRPCEFDYESLYEKQTETKDMVLKSLNSARKEETTESLGIVKNISLIDDNMLKEMNMILDYLSTGGNRYAV